MDYSMKKELMLFHLIPLFFQYFYVLTQEIVKANLCVLKIIISPEIQPEPALVYFGTDLQSELSKVILANSITLTPGTITVQRQPRHGAGRRPGELYHYGFPGR